MYSTGEPVSSVPGRPSLRLVPESVHVAASHLRQDGSGPEATTHTIPRRCADLPPRSGRIPQGRIFDSGFWSAYFRFAAPTMCIYTFPHGRRLATG